MEPEWEVLVQIGGRRREITSYLWLLFRHGNWRSFPGHSVVTRARQEVQDM